MVTQLSRKERRALEFGNGQARAEVMEKIQAAKDREPLLCIKEVDGLIVIPRMGALPMHNYMIPYTDLDDKYKQALARHTATVSDMSGNTQETYATMLSTWFFFGLAELTLTLKENVVCISDDQKIAPQVALKRYMYWILESMEPSQEHKMAYLRYVLDMCCVSVGYLRQNRG